MRTLFDDDHQAFRESFAAWLSKEVSPHYADWERAAMTPREVFVVRRQVRLPRHGDPRAVRRWRHPRLPLQRGDRRGVRPGRHRRVGARLTLHNDVCSPYFIEYCNEEQSQRWMPGIASGELITAIAMTEPGTGSDLASMTTTAIRDGDEYVLNGSKTFITNGINSDLVIVAAKTDPTQRHTGMSLIVVERGMPGFERGRKLEKLGMHSQDTAELFFTDCRVPVANRLGDEGKGFSYLSFNLAQERLSIANQGVAVRPRRARVDRRLREGAHGVRHDDRLVPEHQVRARPGEDRRRRRPGLHRPVRAGAQRRHAHARRGGRRRSCTAPSCRSARSTSACSCSVATATCSSTRSPAPTPTPASRRSTAARAK